MDSPATEATRTAERLCKLRRKQVFSPHRKDENAAAACGRVRPNLADCGVRSQHLRMANT